MKRISIFLFAIILILSSCKEESTNPSDCSLAGLNQYAHPDSLALVDVYLGTLPKCIGEMTNLKVVGLINNEITAIPDEFYNLKDLSYFLCMYNKLDILPDKFDRLMKLEYIVIDSTNLTKIPPTIFKLKNLVHFQFTDSPIIEIPDEIGNSTNLSWLRLNGTNITHLPESIKNLKDCLKQLEIVDTKIPKSHFELIKSWLPNTVINYYE